MNSSPASRSLLVSALAGGLLLMAWAAQAPAHDFWIEPGAFRPDVGESVPVSLRVGQDFSGTSQPFVPDWFLDFSVSGAGPREPVEGLVGDDPAATLAFGSPGLRVIGYYSTRSFVDLDPERFNGYLKTEGLDQVAALRAGRGEAGAHGREYYSRCAKSLVSVGTAVPARQVGEGGFDRVLGYPLELIPRANPYRLAPGDRLPISLQYLGKPIAGTLVIAFTADKPAQHFEARTDAGGRVTLPLDRPGRWLVKAVHMIEVPDKDPAADWESFWASLTFQVRGAK